MRSRIVTSGMAAAAAVVVLGMSVPAFAADEAVSTSGTLETVHQTTEETTGEATGEEDGTSTLDDAADSVDSTVATAEEEIDGAASEGPEPVAQTVDATTDTTTDTSDSVTDTVQQTADEPTGPTDPDGDTKDRRAAGTDPAAAPAGSAPDGNAVSGGGVPTPAPARIALDGFRRTSGGTSTELAVTAEPVFEQEPAFAPPTTRKVVEPAVTAAPPLSLRTVAIEILVAAALLVMATGGLVAELGPERA